MIAPPHLVVGYDGSPLSEAALRRAIQLTSHSRFSMIHVVCVAETDGEEVILPRGQRLHRWLALETLRHIVKACSREWKTTHEHVRIVAHLIEGDPAPCLVDFAYRYHASQIVLGTRGNGDSVLSVGKVAAQVLAMSEIPVHLEAPLSNSRAQAGRFSGDWGHQLRGQSLFGPRLPPWRSPALA